MKPVTERDNPNPYAPNQVDYVLTAAERSQAARRSRRIDPRGRVPPVAARHGVPAVGKAVDRGLRMSAQLPIDFSAATARREAGMSSALNHADDDAPGWGDTAYALLRQFAALHAEPWTCEQFRPWAYARGLTRPPEERAFGPITQKGIRAGVISRVGYAPAASSNGSPKPQYQGVLA